MFLAKSIVTPLIIMKLLWVFKPLSTYGVDPYVSRQHIHVDHFYVGDV